MKHLKKLLIRLQTFSLILTHRAVPQGPLGQRKLARYCIRHETHYDEAGVFESELRLLSQLAILDLLVLDHRQLVLAQEQLHSVEQRFQSFWVGFHKHFFEQEQRYSSDFLLQTGLKALFVVRNLPPPHLEVAVDGEFVDDLAEAAKLREAYLATLVRYAASLLAGEAAEVPGAEGAFHSAVSVSAVPHFGEGVTEKLFEILRGYFTAEDQARLLPLLQANQQPVSPLVFHGNGNQLADAFKQLYEANLIVGCLKGELEEWIALNFAYVYRKQRRTLPPGYLAAIISSNARPCQSPILDVRRQPDGTYAISPVLRTQKNYSAR